MSDQYPDHQSPGACAVKWPLEPRKWCWTCYEGCPHPAEAVVESTGEGRSVKVLVEAKIENISNGHRMASFAPVGGRTSHAFVRSESCRMPDGSPIAADWPGYWDDDGHIILADCLVELELVEEPETVMVRTGKGEMFHVPAASARLAGGRGRPVYRLAVVGECV